MCDDTIMVGEIPVNITKKEKLKNLYIRVLPPDGEVMVTGPLNVSDESIRAFLIKRLPDIIKTRERMRGQMRQGIREYVSGESHYLWGRPYFLQVVHEGNGYGVRIDGGRIILSVPEGATRGIRERTLTEWYRKELKKVLETVVPDCEKKTGLHADEVKVKNMKTRWGTCNIGKRRIWINLQLAKKPQECLEYIVIHELLHLEEKNHNRHFLTLMGKYYPTWKDKSKILSELPLPYMESRC